MFAGVLLPPLVPLLIEFLHYCAEDTSKLAGKTSGSNEDDDSTSLAPSLHDLTFIRPLSPVQQEYINQAEQDISAQARSFTSHIIPNMSKVSKPELVKRGAVQKVVMNNPLQDTQMEYFPKNRSKLDVSQLQDTIAWANPRRSSLGDMFNCDEDSDSECHKEEAMYIFGGKKEDSEGRQVYTLTIPQRFMAFYSAPVVKFWIGLVRT